MQVSFNIDDALYKEVVLLFKKAVYLKEGNNVSDKWRYITEQFVFLNSSKFDHDFDLWTERDFSNTPNKNTRNIDAFNYPHCERFDF